MISTVLGSMGCRGYTLQVDLCHEISKVQNLQKDSDYENTEPILLYFFADLASFRCFEEIHIQNPYQKEVFWEKN